MDLRKEGRGADEKERERGKFLQKGGLETAVKERAGIGFPFRHGRSSALGSNFRHKCNIFELK